MHLVTTQVVELGDYTETNGRDRVQADVNGRASPAFHPATPVHNVDSRSDGLAVCFTASKLLEGKTQPSR